ncbi:MAG TPA: lysophospholipid acyltransferase family protein [Propionibacteriaceae bacterium]|nr:lysophospholipid acyltransferase family protein [Propionibacteriaceae bacterium]
MIREALHRLRPLVEVRTAGLERLAALAGPVVFAANHAHPFDARIVGDACPPRLRPSTLPPALALRAGRSVLVFPEHGVSPDSTVGRFHPDAAALALSRAVPLVPVALRGSFALPHAGGTAAVRAERRTVLVRFGDPVPADGGAGRVTARLRDAVVALLEEDATTWWDTATSEAPAAAPERDSWLVTWQGLEPVRRPGGSERPRIWS